MKNRGMLTTTARFKFLVLVSLFTTVAAYAEPSFPLTYFFDSTTQRWSGETRLGKRLSLDLDKMVLNKISIAYSNDDDVYLVEANAIVDAPADKIFEVSLDYNNYKDFAPHTEGSMIVDLETPAGQDLPSDMYIWTKMYYSVGWWRIKKSISPMMYMRVQPLKGVIEASDYAIRWMLEPRHSDWTGWRKQSTNSVFSVLDGSWYILPLDGNRTYVRYFLKINEDTSYPSAVVSRIVDGPLKSGVQRLVDEIAKRARKLSAGTLNRSP